MGETKVSFDGDGIGVFELRKAKFSTGQIVFELAADRRRKLSTGLSNRTVSLGRTFSR